jgi:hypothetical protein
MTIIAAVRKMEKISYRVRNKVLQSQGGEEYRNAIKTGLTGLVTSCVGIVF